MTTTTAWSGDHFIAGDVALDLANTVYRRTPELGADLLDGPEDLTAWFQHAGVLPPHLARDVVEDAGEDAGEALREARQLRGWFWALFEAQTDGQEHPADALAGVLEVARGGLGGDVAVGPDGAATPLTPRGALAVIALHGLRLVLSPPRHPLRACDRCGWFFLDTSRGRRRRWCSMRTCGNQAKAARYRSAHR